MERDLTGKAEVIRLDVTTQLGQHVVGTYRVRGTPTLIVVDGQGKPVLIQLAVIRPGPVKDQIQALLAQAN